MPKGTKKRPSVLGKNLSRLRRRADVTQRALEERSGVHYTTISRLETGEQQNADSNTIERLARALGVRPAELMEPENGGWISIEPVVQEYLQSTFAATQEPDKEELKWLREKVPVGFWQTSPPTVESIALMIQAHRKRRK